MENNERRMVKVITLKDIGDKAKIVGASQFMYEDEVTINPTDPQYAIVCDFVEPAHIPGKIAESFYDRETGMITVEYRSPSFDDLPPMAQILFLRQENENLKADNIALGQYVTDLELMILGGDNNV